MDSLVFIVQERGCLEKVLFVAPDPNADEALSSTLRHLFRRLSVDKSRPAINELIQSCRLLICTAAWSRVTRRCWQTYRKKYASAEIDELESIGMQRVWNIAESLIRRPKDLVIPEPLRYIRSALRLALDRADENVRKRREQNLLAIELWKEGKLEPKLFGGASESDAPFDGNGRVMELYQLIRELCRDEYEITMVETFVKRTARDEKVPVRVVSMLLDATAWEVRSRRAELYQRLREYLVALDYADIGPLKKTPAKVGSTSPPQASAPWSDKAKPTGPKGSGRRAKKAEPSQNSPRP
jgi:hypothetical protein